jgi:hypothetical protein
MGYKFEGFGTSLAWWSNIKYSEQIKSELIELLFGESGLQMNIVRYNLGGGHNDQVIQNMRSGGLMPCIMNQNGDINLENDSLQLDILDKAVKAGVNKVELFSNSPVWWMTESGLTNGNTKAWKTNLKKTEIDNFAEFLIKSYNKLSEKYPIVSVEPFNEPSNPYWSPKIEQEGCYYDYITRNKVVKSIKNKNDKIPVVVSDESHSLFALLSLPWNLKNISRINVHGYNYFDFKNVKYKFFDWTIWRNMIRFFTKKDIWMSEFGMGYPDTVKDSLPLARNIFRDLQTFKPTAWVYWQVVENFGSEWGLIQLDFNNPIVINIRKQYYIFKHFTRTLKENDTYTFVNNNILKINSDKFIVLNDSDSDLTIDLPGNTFIISDSTRDYQIVDKMTVLPSMSIVTITN